MFQPWFEELVQVVGDLATLITSVIVAIVALYGLSQWKKELKGKAKYEVAKRLIYNAFKFRDQYKRARGMWVDISVASSREKFHEEKENETVYRDEYFARIQRVHPLQKTLREMYHASWEGEILFENIDFGELIEPFEDSFNDLYFAINTYFGRYIERSMQNAEVSKEDQSWLKEYRKIYYGYSNDDCATQIEDITNTFVADLKDIV